MPIFIYCIIWQEGDLDSCCSKTNINKDLNFSSWGSFSLLSLNQDEKLFSFLKNIYIKNGKQKFKNNIFGSFFSKKPKYSSIKMLRIN